MFPYLLRLGPFEVGPYTLGPITLSSYGFMLAVSFILALYVAKRRARTENISPEWIESLTMGLMIWGVIGSRALFIFVEQGTRNWSQPWVFFKVWEGGLSFTGGFVLCLIYTIYRCQKSKYKFWHVTDVISPSLALALSTAKIGCFLAGCCHGKACNLPWAVSFNHPETLAHPAGVPLHPSQLYEVVMAFVVFVILMALWKRRRFEGQIFLAFVLLYGTLRILLEFTRGSEPIHFYGLSSPQTIMLVMVIWAGWMWRRLSKKGQ